MARLETVAGEGIAAGARLFRRAGTTFVSAIAKATFRVVPGGRMELCAPNPLRTDDEHWRGDPLASVERPSDVALFVPFAEIVVKGSACAPAGRLVPAALVGLSVVRGREVVLDKQLVVQGDRSLLRDGSSTVPQPFDRLPIVYERAFGGFTSPENPVGCGTQARPDGSVPQPNFARASTSNTTAVTAALGPAGFGPIASRWAARASLRGSLPASGAHGAFEVELPGDFDERFYQCAPADQRLPELSGDEWIVLRGMHPSPTELATQLPSGGIEAWLDFSTGLGTPLALRADTVFVDADQMLAEIVWRNQVALQPDELEGLRVGFSYGPRGSAPDFSRIALAGGTDAAAVFPLPYASTERASVPPPRAGTMILEIGAESPARPATMVIELPPPPQPRAGTLIIELDPEPAPNATRPDRRAATMIIEEPAPTTLPLQRGPGTTSPSRPARGTEPLPTMNRADPAQPRPGTMVIELGAEATHSELDEDPQSLPFLRYAEGTGRPASTDATPWGGASDAPVPEIDDMESDAGTFVLSPEAASSALAEPPPPIPVVAAPPVEAPAPPVPRDASQLWRKPVEEVALPATPAIPKPAPAPNANLKKDLYKKFR